MSADESPARVVERLCHCGMGPITGCPSCGPEVKSNVLCPACLGVGSVQDGRNYLRCSLCNASGELPERATENAGSTPARWPRFGKEGGFDSRAVSDGSEGLAAGKDRQSFWLIETPDGRGFYSAYAPEWPLDTARQWTYDALEAIRYCSEEQAERAAKVLDLPPYAVREHLWTTPDTEPVVPLPEHEHTFCPHCLPCRKQEKLIAYEDAMWALASYVGNGPGSGEATTPADMEARIREGIDTITRVEKERAPKMLMKGLDTPERVRFYEHDFYVLSNFSAFNIDWRGHIFDTSEHVYHWEKFRGTPFIRDQILGAASAHAAFKIAESHRDERRDDWDDVKVGIMREILRAKAGQHEYVRRKLLATGARELVEDSWRDDFWGWGPNRDGKNMLGKLWMEIRAELRQSSSPKEPVP